jgi:hypothetical protein
MGKRVALFVFIFLAIALTGCADTAVANTPAATATAKPPAATPTATALNAAVVGGTLAAFKSTLVIDKSCTLQGVCFCASAGDSDCDYLVAVPATGATVTKVILLAKEKWALDFTLTFCIQYLPGDATIASTKDGVTQSGTYGYQSSTIGQISMTISPGSCQLSLSHA